MRITASAYKKGTSDGKDLALLPLSTYYTAAGYISKMGLLKTLYELTTQQPFVGKTSYSLTHGKKEQYEDWDSRVAVMRSEVLPKIRLLRRVKCPYDHHSVIINHMCKIAKNVQLPIFGQNVFQFYICNFTLLSHEKIRNLLCKGISVPLDPLAGKIFWQIDGNSNSIVGHGKVI